ncbi:MAG: hypothetical protein IPG50_00240 [Myxococcales bacterium]|nr:hypothetical protein [Myxococcales bacterium]
MAWLESSALALSAPFGQGAAGLAASLAKVFTDLGRAATWLSLKTGLPLLMLSALALVLALRVARKVGRIAIEFALALVLLLALRRLGLMTW